MIKGTKCFELTKNPFSTKQKPSFRTKLESEKLYLIILKFKKGFHCHGLQHDELILL